MSDYGYAASPENWTVNMGSLNNATHTNNNWMYMAIMTGLFPACWTLRKLRSM